MAKRKKDKNQFTIIERHPDADAPTLDEINQTLFDWYHSILITGELRVSRFEDSKVIPSEEKEQRE